MTFLDPDPDICLYDMMSISNTLLKDATLEAMNYSQYVASNM